MVQKQMWAQEPEFLGQRPNARNPWELTQCLSSRSTYAIERCAQFNIDKKYCKKTIAIMTDSQAANGAVSSYTITSRLV